VLTGDRKELPQEVIEWGAAIASKLDVKDVIRQGRQRAGRELP
jgi:hypothetical protein